MKLLELYSLATGLRIDEPFIYKAFYPLPFDKYITLHASSGMPAKNYDFWEDVIDLIKPTLDKLKIKIIQIGGKEDEQIKGCFHLNGGLSLHQSAYILSNTLLHLSNDSFSAHVVGHFRKPLVTIYGSTTVKNHSPYAYDPETTTFIEVDRKGHNASYATEENPKTINFIKPEQIAQAALKIFSENVKRESLHFGDFYPVYIVEHVPDYVLPQDKLSNGTVNIRMDYVFDEDNLAKTIYSRKANIITDKPINLNLVKVFKNNINSFSYEINIDTDLEYVKGLKASGVKLNLVTKESDLEKVNAIRIKFFEFEVDQEILKTKEKLDISSKINENTHFKSNKFILSKDGIFISKADWLIKRAISGFEDNVRPIIDNSDFWSEVDHFYIFNK